MKNQSLKIIDKTKYKDGQFSPVRFISGFTRLASLFGVATQISLMLQVRT